MMFRSKYTLLVFGFSLLIFLLLLYLKRYILDPRHEVILLPAGRQVYVGEYIAGGSDSQDVDKLIERPREIIETWKLSGFPVLIAGLPKYNVGSFAGVRVEEDVLEIPVSLKEIEISCPGKLAIFLSFKSLLSPSHPRMEVLFGKKAEELELKLSKVRVEIFYPDGTRSVEAMVSECSFEEYP